MMKRHNLFRLAAAACILIPFNAILYRSGSHVLNLIFVMIVTALMLWYYKEEERIGAFTLLGAELAFASWLGALLHHSLFFDSGSGQVTPPAGFLPAKVRSAEILSATLALVLVKLLEKKWKEKARNGQKRQ